MHLLLITFILLFCCTIAALINIQKVMSNEPSLRRMVNENESKPPKLEQFVRIEGRHFIIEKERYYYMGTNFWYGLNLGAPNGGNRPRLLRELDRFKELKITNLRIMGGTQAEETDTEFMWPSTERAPGVYDENILIGLDFLLVEMGKRGLKAVVCLNNYWEWSGGFARYVRWALKEDNERVFYMNKAAKNMYKNYIKYLLQRRNTVNGELYNNEPTIMSWQLANEPRLARGYMNWIRETAIYIKSLDPFHLVCTGSEGTINDKNIGQTLIKEIDYSTVHLWVQNWGWYNSYTNNLQSAMSEAKSYLDWNLQIAREKDKPIVLEEFGIARDKNRYSLAEPVTVRNQYYEFIFDYLYKHAEEELMSGCNFWAWGGEGRPSSIGSRYKRGDQWVGDPPHEVQGWYSVFDSDNSTLQLILKYGEMMLTL